MPSVRIRTLRVRGEQDADLPLPRAATPGSAGIDLCAAIDKPLTLESGARALVPTGFALEIPAGFEGQVRARSGLALRHGIVLPNAPATIDSDYRGELQVILMNLGDGRFVIRRGDRIAQLVIAPVVRAELEELPAGAALEPTQRGEGGFGHSGI